MASPNNKNVTNFLHRINYNYSNLDKPEQKKNGTRILQKDGGQVERIWRIITDFQLKIY